MHKEKPRLLGGDWLDRLAVFLCVFSLRPFHCLVVTPAANTSMPVRHKAETRPLAGHVRVDIGGLLVDMIEVAVSLSSDKHYLSTL